MPAIAQQAFIIIFRGPAAQGLRFGALQSGFRDVNAAIIIRIWAIHRDFHGHRHVNTDRENAMTASPYLSGNFALSLIHISEPTRLDLASRMPSSA